MPPTILDGLKDPWGRPNPENDRFSAKSKTPPLLNSREMTLELASGADFLCKLMCGAGPVDLRGPRGPFKGPREPLKGRRGPLKASRGPLKGPRGPLKGPRGPFKGSRGP